MVVCWIYVYCFVFTSAGASCQVIIVNEKLILSCKIKEEEIHQYPINIEELAY